jgi:nitrate reductase delta subunit
MLQPFEKCPEYAAAVDRVRAWTRERFQLAGEAAVFVAEVSCALPGCPPRETVIAFWTDGEQRHQFKVFKPVAEVARDDLPPAWLKNALVVDESAGFECC